MQILELTPHYFRAFGVAQTINFSQELTIFYGGNGTGKSSLAEALEWLFYGYTTRRRKGDSYSKTEYKNSYVNKLCPEGTIPCVEAKVKFPDGTEHTLRREIYQNDSGDLVDTESVLYFDSTKIESLSERGLSFSEAHRPIVVQHGIQDFIHTNPIARYRIISEALGLAELVEFKDVLAKAKNQYQNYPLPELESASKTIRQFVNILNQLGLTKVASRWQKEKIDVEKDYKEIAHVANQLLGSSTTELGDLIANLQAKQAEAMSRIFNIVPHRPTSNYSEKFEALEVAIGQLKKLTQILRQTAANIASFTASTFTRAQISFWQEGVDLVDPANPDICPFCEQPTLTPDHMSQHQARIEANKAQNSSRKAYEAQIDDCKTKVSAIDYVLKQLQIQPISPEAQITLRKAFEANIQELDNFLNSNQEVTARLQSFQSELDAQHNFLNSAKKKIDNPQEVEQLAADILKLPDSLDKQIKSLKDCFPNYVQVFIKFEPILKRELSDEQTVAKYTNLIKIFEEKYAAELVEESKKLDREILECQRQTDQYILNRQKEILTTRGKEVIEWYGYLSPNTDVQFSGLIPGKNEFRLRAKAFGEELEAAACLSQAQLNCLGLSIYIPSVIDKNSPFGFIFFDDPVQAMDDEHHESFLLVVMPELLDKHQSQVIVLTHLDSTAKRMRELNIGRDYRFYRFDKMQPTGPVIKEDQPINGQILRIRQLSHGDESERSLAVDRIRVVCEMIMREACLNQNIPIKPKASAADMLVQFRNLPDVSAKRANGLQDTIRWSDPSHHTDQTWTVPTTTQIGPHISRLESFINDLKL